MDSFQLPRQATEGLASLSLISIDISSLQNLLTDLTHQVQACQRDNANLRKELQELKIANRLLTLEFTFEDFRSDLQNKWDSFEKRFRIAALAGVGSQPKPEQVDPDTAAASSAALSAHPATAPSSSLPAHAATIPQHEHQHNVLQDKLTGLERRCDEMWQAQVEAQQSRAAVGRLQKEVEAMQATVATCAQSVQGIQSKGDGLGSTVASIHLQTQKLQDRIKMVEEQQQSDGKEALTSYTKREQQMQSVQDRLKTVESSMGQHVKAGEGLTASLRQQDAKIGNLQDLISSLQQKTQKQVNVLELKADSIDDRMALALAPISDRMGCIEDAVERLKAEKLNVSDALTADDVTRAIQRAHSNQSQQMSNAFQGISGLQAQVDQLQATKADKDVSIDFEKLAAALESLDVPGKLDQLQKRVDVVLKTKADLVKVDGEHKKLTVRSQCLETALLRGLKTISDKVSAALDLKADRAAFEEFRLQAKALISEMLLQIREWSPLARSTTHTPGCQDGVACLSCDSPVRTIKELKQLHTKDGHDPLCPEKLPNVEPWKMPPYGRPATSDPFRGCSANGRLAAQRHATRNVWTRPATTSEAQSRQAWRADGWLAVHATNTPQTQANPADSNQSNTPSEDKQHDIPLVVCAVCGDNPFPNADPSHPASNSPNKDHHHPALLPPNTPPVLTITTPAPPTPQQHPSTPSNVRLNRQTVSGQIAQGRIPSTHRRNRGEFNQRSRAGSHTEPGTPQRDEHTRAQSPMIEGWNTQETLVLESEPTVAFPGLESSEGEGNEAPQAHGEMDNRPMQMLSFDGEDAAHAGGGPDERVSQSMLMDAAVDGAEAGADDGLGGPQGV